MADTRLIHSKPSSGWRQVKMPRERRFMIGGLPHLREKLPGLADVDDEQMRPAVRDKPLKCSRAQVLDKPFGVVLCNSQRTRGLTQARRIDLGVDRGAQPNRCVDRDLRRSLGPQASAAGNIGKHRVESGKHPRLQEVQCLRYGQAGPDGGQFDFLTDLDVEQT